MSEISKQALKVDNTTSFPNNTTGYISPTILRAFNVNMIDSLVDEITYTADSASWNVSIGQLNQYTSSFAPSLSSLNAFTASQLTINTGVNQFTQSANASINRLDTFSSSFNAYTSSINQIRSNGVTLGTSTIFNLVGPGTFFSASLVQNVQGNIATLTFTSDAAKVNTSSFNDYTASTAATQSVFSASVANSITGLTNNFNNYTSSTNVSIAALNAFTASDNTSQAALNAFTASQNLLNGTFATTASFNAFTSSINDKTGSYITTGSATNTLQVISGAFAFNTTYMASAPFTSQDGGSNVIYVDYGDAFGGPYSANMIYWNDTSFNGVTVNGTGVSNATVTGVGYGSYFELTLSSGTVTNGASYTFTGPGIQTISITGSLNVKQQINVDSAAGNTVYMNGSGFAISNTNNQSAGLTPGMLQLIDNNNGNRVFSFAATSSVMFNGGGTWQGGPQMAVYDNNIGDVSVIGFESNENYVDGRVTILTPLVAQSGSIITGSVFQNVLPITISAQTASIDLGIANYFTLTLSGSTKLNVINAQPGVTATLVINTDTGASASFSSNVKQPSGSFYAASPSGNVDIISLTAVDTSSVYIVPAYTFV